MNIVLYGFPEAATRRIARHYALQTIDAPEEFGSRGTGLLRYFRHVEPYMEQMRDLLSRQQSPAWVMPFARKRMGLM